VAFREKMLWISLATTLAIWGWYFMGFVGAFRAGRFDQAAETDNFVAAVFLIVVVHIVMAVVLAIVSGREAQAPADDREKAIAMLGYRSAYTVLTLIVVMLMITGPILLRIAYQWAPPPPPGMAPVLMGNALLAALVIAEIANAVTQLIRFRKGS
jgi:Kef-type K+ transport system membrane component KefB